MTRPLIGTLLAVLLACGGCAARSSERPQTADVHAYQLIRPPDMPDKRYPGGVHVQTDAALASWHQVAVFATLEECDSSRVNQIDDSIDKARLEVGERAKYQLPVRRAVHARCVLAQ